MSDSIDNALRGGELAVKAGYLAVIGIAIYAAWKLFGSKGTRRMDVPTKLPADDPSVTGHPKPKNQGDTSGGIVLGGLGTSIVGFIVDPPADGNASRSLFRSTFPATIELSNQSNESQSALVDLVGDFDEIIGGSRNNVHTQLGPFQLAPLQVARFDVQVETGIPFFSIGPTQANATFKMLVDGELVSSSYFYVE